MSNIIGNNIREARQKKDMSLRELDEKSGVTFVSLSRYENGKRIPTITTMIKIADALDMPITELLKGYEHK